MNIKKIGVGALSLALSFGAISPIFGTDKTTVYASEQSSKTEDKTQKIVDLDQLLDEYDKVKESDLYTIATKDEKTAYENAIEETIAEKAKEEPENLELLAKKIIEAKNQLGANSFVSAQSRDGLGITLAMADKLANDPDLSNESKEKLDKAVDAAKKILADVEMSKDEIDQENISLAKLMDELIEKDELDASKYTLSAKEMAEISSLDKANVGKGRASLYALSKKAKAFYDSKYKEDDQEIATKLKDLYDALIDTNKTYNTLTSKADELSQAHERLKKALEDTEAKFESDTSSEDRLKSELESLINDKIDQKDAISKLAIANYNAQVKEAKAVLDKEDSSKEEKKRALDDLKLAKLAVKPVQTKTITEGLSESDKKKISLGKLNDLIKEKDTFTKSENYKNAEDTAKKVYDAAITEASEVEDLNNLSLDKINEHISLIENAKKTIEDGKGELLEKEDPSKDDMTDLLDQLKAYKDNEENVKQSNKYRNATDEQKKAYDDAINKTLAILNRYADKDDSLSIEDLKATSGEVKKSLAAIDYTDGTQYPDDLAALVNEADDFRSSEAFQNKANSSDDFEKSLVDTYNKLIADAKAFLEKNLGEEAGDAQKDYIEKINDAKKAITEDISKSELDLRDLLRLDPKFRQTPKYINAKNNTNEDLRDLVSYYESLIKKAQNILNNTNRTDAEMGKLIGVIKNARITIENPSEKNLALSKITRGIDLVGKIFAHPDYSSLEQQYRVALEKAIEKINKIDESSSDEEINQALSDLESALNVKKIQEIIEDIKEKESTEEKTINDLLAKDLLDLAMRVISDDAFDEVDPTQKKNVNEAIKAIKDALESENEQDIMDAKVRLRSSLMQNRVRPITDRLFNQEANKDDNEANIINKLKGLIDLAEKVEDHKAYEKLDQEFKDKLSQAINEAKAAVNSKDITKIDKAKSDLDNILKDDQLKEIMNEISGQEEAKLKNKIEQRLAADESFRKTTKFLKAQDELRESYIKAIDFAKDLIAKDDYTNEDLAKAYKDMDEAAAALDGDKFEESLSDLEKKFKENSDKITDSKIRKEIEEALKSLKEDGMTMTDLLVVKEALSKAIPQNNATARVIESTGQAANPSSVTTTTKTVPVTTTRSMPATVTPGSIVRTGIESLAGVGIVLVLAILGYFFVNKKDKDKASQADKTRTNKTNDKKKMTFEGDNNENNK